MAGRTTINDVAQLAHVSIGTVHRALSGKSGIRDETRRRIIEAANQLGYQPNTAASMLRKKPLNIVISFPAPTEHNRYFFGELWNGYRDAAGSLKAANCNVTEIPYYSDNDNSFAANIERLILQGKEIDGIVTGGKLSDRDLRTISLLCSSPRKIPLVIVGENYESVNCLSNVSSDHITDGRMAAELLCGRMQGRGDILVMAGDINYPSNFNNARAFEDYVSRNAPGTKVIKIHWPASETRDNEEELVQRIITTLKDIPTIRGLYTVCARGTLYIAKAVQQMHPEQPYSIIGSDLYRESADFLRDGIIDAIIYKNPRRQACIGIEHLLHYLSSGRADFEKNERLTSLIVIRSNVDKYYPPDASTQTTIRTQA